MLMRHSLRFRIIIAFGLFGVVLGAAYGSMVLIGLHLVEDNTFFHRMQLEAKLFEADYQKHPQQAELPRTRYLDTYLGLAQMPEQLRRHLAAYQPGRYSLSLKAEESVQGTATEYYILVTTITRSEELLYLVYDVTDLEPLEQTDPMLVTILFVAMLLVTALGVWLGMLTSKQIIAPLVRLAKQTEAACPGHVSQDFSAGFYHDEVGSVARTLEQLLRRTEAFVDRERQFTRNASHELRTPVTVIKGASELLNSLPEAQERHIQRPLQRIIRANQAMEHIIEAFLQLAREDMDSGQVSDCDLTALLEQCIAQHQHLIEHKPVQAVLDIPPAYYVSAPASLLSIVCANLVSNAFVYTDKGEVRISIDNDCLQVSDTGIGIEAELLAQITQAYIRGSSSKGHGLGLNITQNICLRLGWDLSIASVEGEGTRIRVCFNALPATAA